MFYDTARLKMARNTFESLLRRHAPEKPMEGPLSLTVEWRFATKTHKDGAYRVTRPDTDNLQKLLKDCMTASGFNPGRNVCGQCPDQNAAGAAFPG